MYPKISPKSNSGKLVKNGRINNLIVGGLGFCEIPKSLFSKNNREELSVGDLLELTTNQHSCKLGISLGEDIFKDGIRAITSERENKAPCGSATFGDPV